MKKRIIVVALFAVVAFSCSKKNDPAPATREQLLTTAKGWILTAGTINPPIQIPGAPSGTPAISDFFGLFLEDCEKDDVFLFTSSGQYRIDEGATKCDPSDQQIKEQGTWAFNSAKTVITVTQADGGSYDINISELSATTLKITESFDPGTGTTYSLTLTYAAVK
jgi:hypothetical protein